MLKDILAIAGQPGLYKMVAQAKNGIIVESLETGKRIPAYAHSKVSALEDIAIYTDEEEVPLVDVFKNIADKEEMGPSINPKSSGEDLKNYFEDVLPDYDKERVYTSDIKKVLQWYNVLQKLELLNFEEESSEAEEKDEKGNESEVKEESQEKTDDK